MKNIFFTITLVAALSAGFLMNRTEKIDLELQFPVSMFADSEARTEPISTYETREWLNYFNNDQMPWDCSLELELPEYPNTVFRWTPYKVTAIDKNGEKTLFEGMPVWNVYLADLTGDDLPEFCSTVSIGSGIVDNRIIVYDYSNDEQYELSDRFYFDYALTFNNKQLIVTESKFNGTGVDTGNLEIINGKLTATGIYRVIPTEVEPRETTPPITRNATTTLHEAFYEIILRLYRMDPALNNSIKYIAVDMTGVFENERSALEINLRTWAESLNCELLIGTYTDLVNSGYITPLPSKDEPFVDIPYGFIEGILFRFSESSFNGETLTMNADKYRSPLGAVGAEFTIHFMDGNWVPDEPEFVWMA